ncbi:MAG TPA: sn-glycerol-3-phosphate ABC transporter ATP-binding protein UgpC [Thermoleophilia bacterium]|nr:sn-glycerol-3-phosphate ABC transporter ATP-binding protein UgpC [Thermoleophilia bacterium]
MAVVAFRGVSKVYAGGARAVSHMDLEIGDGEFVVLVGPSGCGKTTALRMLAGLETITEGAITIGDRVVNHVAPKDRDIAMVFQNYALYPHLTVYDNIAFGLRLRKTPKDEIDERVRHAAEVLGLEDFLERKPRALSGGQRQRVAMGRAIVREPQAFLMDEPLSNLDAKLRVQMRAEISSLQDELGVTTVYVTHDQIEAMTMGDRVAVMRKGELQQVAPPQELYDRPVNLFVAGFIGSPTMNMMEAVVESDDGGGLALTIGEQRLRLAPETRRAHPALERYIGRGVVLGVRPEDLEDAALAGDAPEDRRLRGRLMLREALGSEVVAHFEIDAPPVLTEDTRELAEDIGTGHHYEAHAKRRTTTSKLVGRFSARTAVREGETLEIAVDTRALHFFDVESGLGIYGGEEARTRPVPEQPRPVAA